MARTAEEKFAIERDIMQGIKAICDNIQLMHKQLPIAVAELNPHATSTRKLLEASAKLYEAGRAFEHVRKLGITVKGEK